MGPLAVVDTQVEAINLDVARLLSWGPGITLKFVVPDSTEVTGWRTLATLTAGFNRITSRERTSGDGSQVIFHVADPTEALDSVFVEKDLHVDDGTNKFAVATVPPLAPNEAHVFIITCKTRTLRNKYFDNKK